MRLASPLVPLMAAAALALGAGAARATVVWLQPADTTVTLGQPVTLRVMTDAFADLKGYQLVYGYDGARLSLTGVTAGDLLTAPSGAWTGYLLPDVTAPADSVWYDAARLDGSTAGPGVLAYLTFGTTAIGDAVLTCGSVDFRDSANARTLPACAGAVVSVLGPVGVAPSTWGRIKSLYR